MPLTLLQLVQTACDELGLVRPSTVVSSPDPQVRQFLGLANREGRELQQTREWTVLQNETIINIVAPTVTTGNIITGSGVIAGIPNTSGIVANQFACSGPGIPVAARVQSVDSSSQVTLNMEATGNATGASITFARDTYSLPDDFDRFINETWWDRTNRWQLFGPTSPQIDQWHKSGVVTVGPRRWFRQKGRLPAAFMIWPPPAVLDSPLEFATEYISANWVLRAGGATANSFTLDTDTTLLDENAVILGLKWRFWQIKGFDYAPLQREYIDHVDRLGAQDGGAQTLSLARRGAASIFVSPSNIQDGFFPGPSGPNTG
jgi:hypothetical protein